MKYREWLAEWLEYYVKPTVKARTYEKYKRQATLYLSPCLGEYEIENLTPLFAKVCGVDYGERTVAKYGERDYHVIAVILTVCGAGR